MSSTEKEETRFQSDLQPSTEELVEFPENSGKPSKDFEQEGDRIKTTFLENHQGKRHTPTGRRLAREPGRSQRVGGTNSGLPSQIRGDPPTPKRAMGMEGGGSETRMGLSGSRGRITMLCGSLDGRGFCGEWIDVYICLSPFAVHQKLSHH